MNSRGFDKNGRYGAGIPSDVGFCRNVKHSDTFKFKPYSSKYKSTILCYGNGKFVSFCHNSSRMNYSEDGITWNYSNVSTPNTQWKSVCYGNGKFVAVTYSIYYAYSTDGINWTLGKISENNSHSYWSSVCYGDNKFVAVSNIGYYAYSPNGINWTVGTTSLGTSTGLESVCYGNGKFVAVAYNSYAASGNMRCIYSTNGTIWTAAKISDINRKWISVCCCNNFRFVAIAESSNICAYSNNGINWYESSISSTNREWSSICYGNKRSIAIAANSNYFAYSFDGFNWIESRIFTSSTEIYFDCICYGYDKFVAGLNTTGFAYSYMEKQIIQHTPLYKVTDVNSLDYHASLAATTTTGGIITTLMSNKVLTIYPNGSTEGIAVSPVDDNYWNNNHKFMIHPISNANYLHNIFCFVSINKSTDGGGLVLYITPNFINWNIHQIIPDTASIDEWEELTGSTNTSYSPLNNDAKWVQEFLEKYFHVLPNNNYLIFYPLPMYKGEDKTTMATLYSPWQNEALLNIKDPYNSTEDYKHKAIYGISAYLSENGEEILHYNYRLETPLVLYYGRSMGTYSSDVYTNYNHEIVEAPKIAKVYGLPEVTSDRVHFQESIDGMSIDLAINTVESRNSKLTDDDIPAASVGLAIGDAADTINKNSSEEFTHYNQIELYVDKKIDMMDNIDIDFNKYLFRNGISGNDVLSGENIDDVTAKCIEITISDTNRYWSSLCYGNGKFVAISSDNIFAYSTNGITWTEVTVGDTNSSWSVCYGNDKFVAVSYGDSTFAYSTDGINWTTGTISNTERDWYSVCYGNGKFVAVANNSNTFAYSTDGITWTEGTISDTERDWYSVCYGNGKFVAIAYDSEVHAYSEDGIIWNEINIGIDTFWNSLCHGNGKFLAVGEFSTFAYSTDGITWTEGHISNTGRIWTSVCYSDGKFVTIAYNSNIFAYSIDGINWTEGVISETTREWRSVCCGGGKFVAVSSASNTFAYYDIIKLTPAPIPVVLNECVLSINAVPTHHRTNARYRATIFGNTLYSDTMKLTNNPSLGTKY